MGNKTKMNIVENIDRHMGKYGGISTTNLRHLLHKHNEQSEEKFDIVSGMKMAMRLIARKHRKADLIVMTDEELELARQDKELRETLLGETDASST